MHTSMIGDDVASHAQSTSGSQRDHFYKFPYPAGVYRLLLRLPIWLYRFGLGELLNILGIMVLTTRGRVTGLPRHTAIEYRIHGSKVYVVSAWGQHPNWVRNLLADSTVSLRRGRQGCAAQAHIVEAPGESLRVLHLFRKRAPFFYDPLIARLSGTAHVNNHVLPEISDQFTIVRFDPQPGEPTLAPVQGDLRWAWLVVLAAVMGWALFNSFRRDGNSA